jgi:steroid delta-isomerase-like uncharacterized protein
VAAESADRGDGIPGTETTRHVVARYFDFMNSADTSIADDILSPDVVFVGPAAPDGISGREAFVQFVTAMRSASPDLRFSEVESVVEGERMATRFTMSGTYPATYRGGQQFSTDGMDLFHLRNGRIERISAYFDRLGRDSQGSDAT